MKSDRNSCVKSDKTELEEDFKAWFHQLANHSVKWVWMLVLESYIGGKAQIPC